MKIKDNDKCNLGLVLFIFSIKSCSLTNGTFVLFKMLHVPLAIKNNYNTFHAIVISKLLCRHSVCMCVSVRAADVFDFVHFFYNVDANSACIP